jgi:cob(I)alamin adenosyltransferase
VRVGKDDLRVEAYGTVDETNAAIGLARALGAPRAVDDVLACVQNELFVVGSELACTPGKEDRLRLSLIGKAEIERIEQAIDAAEGVLPPLQQFILPTGTPAAAALHHARTICRRAERSGWAARRSTPIREELLVYLNRLSDLLFVLARRCNLEASVEDTPWASR